MNIFFLLCPYALKKKILFIFRGREKQGERNLSVWLPLEHSPIRVLARNPGICPDWESNQWPFGLQAATQSTEPHQPGLNTMKFIHGSLTALSLRTAFVQVDFCFSFLTIFVPICICSPHSSWKLTGLTFLPVLYRH